jgi:hypothetical protein
MASPRYALDGGVRGHAHFDALSWEAPSQLPEEVLDRSPYVVVDDLATGLGLVEAGEQLIQFASGQRT